jgi:protein-S-isoprenylcysteine O-methyltransferase Ste14
MNSMRLLDRVEQLVALALYAWFVSRLWPADFYTADWAVFLMIASEGMVVVMLLLRRPTGNISPRFGDWLVALAGTCAALLVVPGGPPVQARLGVLLVFIGFVTHVGAKLGLWRSFGLVAANRGVRTQGPYRYVRHPMYAGYMLTHAGFLLAAWSWWNLGVYAVAWTLLVARIAAEERTLREDPAYREYMQRVRYRLVPLVY